MNKIYLGDNLQIMAEMEPGSVNLIYADPPFNTGRTQRRGAIHYSDSHYDYIGMLTAQIYEMYRIIAKDGTIYLHVDPREVHHCREVLDNIFGMDAFLNEIVWAYDYGGRAKDRWPPKHDNILVYVKDPQNYVFNYEEIERIPYMAPGLVGPEKAARGKLPTDVWWHTIVATNGKEKTGYPTQKPLAILRRIIQASSRPGDLVLDPFAGSGTTGMAAHELGRQFIMIDNSLDAIRVMTARFSGMEFEYGH